MDNGYYEKKEMKDGSKDKEARGAILGKGQNLELAEEDEPKAKSNGVAEDNSGSATANSVSGGLSQGPAVDWERFLPIRTPKVLLVENDDSTRHLVSALLRNCSYEVIAVSNGLQAWKILEDLTTHVDLVLTEVAMPLLSGIGLLCKIMNHKTFKNIPVIMMSTHDSMGLVFKCLSKGAVDFLVKPVRKNELKILWQHVWRRCHSSSGSGSESGTESKRCTRSQGNNESDNNTGSSNEHDDGNIGLSLRDGSDSGSGTQSSWTKRATPTESLEPNTPSDKLAEAPDSTCAQVFHTIHNKLEISGSSWVHSTDREESLEENNHLDKTFVGNQSCMHISETLKTHQEQQLKCSMCKKDGPDSGADRAEFAQELSEHKNDNISGKLKDQSLTPVGTVPAFGNLGIGSQGPGNLTDHCTASLIIDETSCNIRIRPSLEKTSEEVKAVKDVRASVHHERNCLRHSDVSAFAKYRSSNSANQAHAGNDESSSPAENSALAMKVEMINHSYYSENHQSTGGSNNIASTTVHIVEPKTSNDKLDSVSTFKCLHPSTLQPVQDGLVCIIQNAMPEEKVKDTSGCINPVEAQGRNQQVQVQHHYHHHHHHHHHVHKVQHHLQIDHDDISLKSMAITALQCGSSNKLDVPLEVTAANCSINGSASGSNHGSNGKNGSGNGMNMEVDNNESENGAAGSCKVTNIHEEVGRNGAEADRSAQREAALNKFRQKRKDRCFEKKVRYQSRKRLAEQRPRIRGQFVRQMMSDINVDKDLSDSVTADKSSSEGVQ